MKTISRRKFLHRAGRALGGALAFPYIVPGRALGKDDAVAPSERIVLGAIGLGGRGVMDLEHFLNVKRVQCVAVCDCFADRRAGAKALVDKHYGNTDCQVTRFHEELLGRQDIDAVLIATGDRWHAVLSSLAARAGKDVYCEKPFCLTIAEGQGLASTLRRCGTVWQVGTQRRSNPSYRSTVEVVQSGLIGKLKKIRTSYGWPWRSQVALAAPAPAPDVEVFDWDRWLGQAPWAPYSPERVDYWRQNWDTGGGVIADMGPHFLETALWAVDFKLAGPVAIEGTGQFVSDGFIDIPVTVQAQVQCADGLLIKMDSAEKMVHFEGDQGWIRVDDYGNIDAEPKSILKERTVSGFSFFYLEGHVGNFLDCVRTRRQPVSNVEVALATHTLIHAANLSIRLKRPLRWDVENRRFLDDPEANRMLTRTMRAPWRV